MYASPSCDYDCPSVDADFQRAQIRAGNKMAMLQFLGARMEGLQVAWWPIRVPSGPTGNQKVILRSGRYFSGLRDWTRGRHWDRRSRYGER